MCRQELTKLAVMLVQAYVRDRGLGNVLGQRSVCGDQNKRLRSLTMRMATKQARVVFQSPLAVAEAFPTSML